MINDLHVYIHAHLLQQPPLNVWSNSAQWRGGHMTPRHKTLSALLFMPTPPDKPLAHDLSSGTLTFSAQQRGQQVPESSGLTNLKGGLQSTAAQAMPVQVSDAPLPGEYTGYAAAMAMQTDTTKNFITLISVKQTNV